MKDVFNIVVIILMAICLGIISTVLAPSEWEVSSIKNDFGDPIKNVACVKDTFGVSLTHIEHLDDSYFVCEIIEPTGSIGNAQVKLRNDDGSQCITHWDFIRYDPRTKTDRYEITGAEYQKLKELLENNNTITVSLKDSIGSNLIKTIQCKGFDRMVVKSRNTL